MQNEMATETKIREAFENTPRCVSDGDFGAFEAGYLAAMASLEQAIWIQSNHIDCAKKGPFLSRTGPQKMQSDWVPLYRIKGLP